LQLTQRQDLPQVLQADEINSNQTKRAWSTRAISVVEDFIRPSYRSYL